MRARSAFLTTAAGAIARRYVAAFVLCLAAGCVPRDRAMPTTLPNQAVLTLDGREAPIADLLRGRVALVSLWATWCDACVREVGALNRLAVATASRDDAVVLGVAVGESRSSVDAFVRDRGIHYAQILDEDFHFADALGERDVPTTLVVDRTGRIVYRGDSLNGAGIAAFRAALGVPIR